MAIRRIYCKACEKIANRLLEPDEVLQGWQQRTVTIIAQKPADHHVTVIDYKTHGDFFKGKPAHSKRTDLSSLFCDHCGNPIPDGSTATAYTAWRGEEPGPWETDYAAKPNPPPP